MPYRPDGSGPASVLGSPVAHLLARVLHPGRSWGCTAGSAWCQMSQAGHAVSKDISGHTRPVILQLHIPCWEQKQNVKGGSLNFSMACRDAGGPRRGHAPTRGHRRRPRLCGRLLRRPQHGSCIRCAIWHALALLVLREFPLMSALAGCCLPLVQSFQSMTEWQHTTRCSMGDFRRRSAAQWCGAQWCTVGWCSYDRLSR